MCLLPADLRDTFHHGGILCEAQLLDGCLQVHTGYGKSAVQGWTHTHIHKITYTCTHTHTCTQKCPTEIFVDHIWVPAFKTGLIEIVEECLKTLDSSLAAWEVYLTAACRFFTQRGLFSVLYRTQLFMQV